MVTTNKKTRPVPRPKTGENGTQSVDSESMLAFGRSYIARCHTQPQMSKGHKIVGQRS
jgi:hypothetical protein